MKIKLAVSVILAFLVFLFITQNTETVQVKFLLWSIEMSLVLMVFIIFVTGAIIGWLTGSYVRYISHRKRPPVVPPQSPARHTTGSMQEHDRATEPADKKEASET